MTYPQAIEQLRGRIPDWWRLEYYGRDNVEPELRDRTRAEAIRRASGPLPPIPPRPTVHQSLATLAAVNRCPYRSPGVGCQCGRCALRQHAKVTTQECLSCVIRYPDS